MGYCPECKVHIFGTGISCPLCGSKLEPDSGPEDYCPYPEVSARSKPKEPFPMAARILAFVSLAAMIICTVLDLLISHKLTWSLYVTAGILTGWITIALPIIRNINLNYMLLLDLCAISALLVLVDAKTGWNRWSVTIVLPCFYIAIAITTVVLALVFHDYWREYILSLIAVSALGIFPLLTLLTGLATVPGFCLAAVFFALLLLAAVFFFGNRKLFSEWKRRMNI